MSSSRFRLAHWIMVILSPFLLTACQTEPPSFEGREIARTIIRAKGPDAMAGEKKVLDVISSKPNTFYSAKKVEDDIKHLYESASFEDVRIEPKLKGDRVNMIINVQTKEQAEPLPENQPVEALNNIMPCVVIKEPRFQSKGILVLIISAF